VSPGVRSDGGGLHLPGDAVQGLVGSPGWIVFGTNGGGDRVAIDLTPGPRGNIGQVIMIDHEQNIGAGLYARSLTALPGTLADPLEVSRLTSLEFLALGPWIG
jgi:cell wall assembly regulator SMI1